MKRYALLPIGLAIIVVTIASYWIFLNPNCTPLGFAERKPVRFSTTHSEKTAIQDGTAEQVYNLLVCTFTPE